MKLPFLFKSSETTTTAAAASSAPSWRWPACAAHPRTLSFRSEAAGDRKTIHNHDEASSSPEPQTAMTMLTSSERFFFEPGSSNSILEEAKKTGPRPRKSAVILVMLDSHDPVRDFRASMEDMVAARRGGCDWEYLENLLECYLRENGERNHGYIIGAFVDLVFRLDSGSESSAAADGEARRSFSSSTLSFSSSSAGV
ncbi:ovate family protein 15 [Striga asiatica]|uniref:Transcription repressor n=1 Tax=Striga asiatica TaxID=4170 RepID=A0A5A7PN85_STRAF|nr:ovate family protein 15 [Striga asiatica]